MKTQYTWLALAGLAMTVGCTNGKVIKKVTASAVQTTTFNFQITGVSVQSTATSGDVSTLQVSPLAGAGPLSNFCGPGGACSCNYTWIYSGVNRFDVQAVTTAAATNATCPTPLQWQEIPTGANVTIELSSATNLVRAAPFVFVKGGSGTGVSVDFTDSSGRGYRNILRATVYEQQRVYKTIQNQIKTASKQLTGGTSELNVHSAARFCPGGTSGVEGCEGQDETPSVSNLQIPYNIYYPATTSLPASNSRYIVVAVNSSNVYPADSTFALSPTNFDGAIPVETNSKPTNPLDATTAPNTCRNGPTAGTLTNDRLASQCVGFAAPTNADGSCPSVQFQGSTVNMVRLRQFHAIYPLTIQINGANTGKVLAQAQAVDTVLVADRILQRQNGTNFDTIGTYRGPLPCPFSIFDKEGVSGFMYQWNQSFDPSVRPYETKHGGVPQYVASNDPAWNNGASFDGGSYPNIDSFDRTSKRGSCSAILPLWERSLDRTQTNMYLRTEGIPSNRIQIKNGTPDTICTAGASLNWSNGGNEGFPIVQLGGVDNHKILGTAFEGTGGAFLPEWEEDKSFKACVLPAMRSTGTNMAVLDIKDPPIHTMVSDTYAPDVPLRNFASSSAGILQSTTRSVASWCAETLPTQNRQVDKLELTVNPNTYSGLVKNYTSHYKKSQIDDPTDCTARTGNFIPTGYPVGPTFTPFASATPAHCTAGIIFPSGFNASTQITTGWANHPGPAGPFPGPGGSTFVVDEHATCDKDIMNSDLDYAPLLQNARDTERSLRQRPNVFGCFVTSGTADYHYKDKGLRTPTSCCSPAIMSAPSASSPAGHFEPGTDAFCGFARD